MLNVEEGDDLLSTELNEETMEAIEEARSGKYAGIIDTSNMENFVCVTGQHREMLDQVLRIFGITPNFDLNIMKQGQDLYDVTARVLTGMRDVLKEVYPDLVLVHGDTTTSTSAALAAFYQQIPVGHVEAGLRTHNIYSPWPEEMNRQLTGRIATYHFAPTPLSKQNLLAEGVEEKQILVTGNTVIDALYMVVDKIKNDKVLDAELEATLNQAGYDVNRLNEGRRLILITGHRRENFGEGFIHICTAIRDLVQKYPEVDFVQLQLNYADWENPVVQSRGCHEVARRHGKPIIVMEPVKGGMLANPPASVMDIFEAAVPNRSAACWALRFAAHLDGVMVVLSGMSTMEQVHDNIACMQSFAGFGREEEQAIEKAQEALARIPVIPCTSCNYCAEVCPGDIGISGSFTAMNYLTMYGNMAAARHQENWLVTMHQRKRADECLQCGACEEVCPQHIHIRDELKRVCATFGINGEG